MAQDNMEKSQGISLALDPNLIALPIHRTSTSPNITSVSAVENPVKVENEELSMKVEDKTDMEQVAPKSLIGNPYEQYGQMKLSQLIPLITQQRGPGVKFADITEQLLQEEISAEVNNEEKELNIKNDEDKESNDEMDIDEQGLNESARNESNLDEFNDLEKPNDSKPVNILEPLDRVSNEVQLTQEQFNKMRKDMLEHINMAMNESSLAMEFVSLLLSPVRESTAVSSMSPFLKKTVSPGSLNSDKVRTVEKPLQEQLLLKVTSRGWKLRALNQSRALLKQNYLEISNSIKKEHDFWLKISNNISNKDVIFKLRDRQTNKRSLGLKYGYEDSGSMYRHDSGTAILRANSESDQLELIPFTAARAPGSFRKKENFIRVRIFTKIESEGDYILCGESSLDKLFINHDNECDLKNEDIRLQISKLKFFIFEQELMHQLKKECIHLISYGVTVENEHKIVIELPNEKFEIEYLSLDDDSVVNHKQDAPKANDKRANLILVTLRLLLIVVHKKNLRQKLTAGSRKNISSTEKDILLIRPILGKMRHSNHRLLLKKIIKDCILDVVKDAEIIETDIQESSGDNGTNYSCVQDAHIMKLNKDIKAFDDLLNVGKKKFEIDLKENGSLELILSSPNYCNAHVSIKYKNSSKNVDFNTSSTEFKEVEEFLHFLISTYVSEN
ncbi:Mediator of RNA polymerase II transcription subunit 17 [Nakaseomyces bracarensis]|uniref:Mediator of RNA polymerase II transcription subunit 17 n=1 Tax=Nakaseomyces bracarensis TaxID=273131 RepID=A0ABR4NP38_9SACH